MLDTSARVLRLLSLLQSRLEWTGPELAERLGVTTRTVRNDVTRLRKLGYPVDATPGTAGGYRLGVGAVMPPLLLDDDEAVAIAVGLRTAAGHAVDGIDEASVRALTKLEQILPSRLRRRVSVLNSATMPLLIGDGPTVNPATLTLLATTIANHERLRFGYQAADGTESKRLVEPHRLVSAGRRWYLLAYDNDRDDWRIFRVDRVRDPRPTGARSAPRQLPAKDAAAYVTSTVYSRAPTYRTIATLHAPVKEVARKLGDTAGELTPLDERTCRLRSHTDTLEWLAFGLTMLGCEFEVHEPRELAEYLRAMGARVIRAAGNL